MLDSSFNPPTKAHLAIAASSFPDSPSLSGPGEYTSKLLLYTPKNADKVPKDTDASPAQRVEMMLAQAGVLNASGDCVAVGILPAANFVDKALILRSHVDGEITFLVGTDTLVRIFDERYYDDMDHQLRTLFSCAYLVSIGRGDSAAEKSLLAKPEVATWVQKGRVRFLPSLPDVAEISSTRVRQAVKNGQGVEEWCTPPVTEIITREGLYK